MKTLSTALQSHLDSRTTTLSWAWRITRNDGQVFGFTDHDLTLTFDGTSFEPDSGFTASELRASDDLGVDAQDAEGVLSSGRITETDIAAGVWDGAAIEVWRVNWADTSQRVLLRRGAIGEVRRGKIAFTAEMRSMAHVLDQPVGRTFQATCDAVLGDARCGVNLESAGFKGSGSVATVQRDRAFTASGLGAYANGLFTFGTLIWGSGANAGATVEVERHEMATSGTVTVTLLEAPVLAIAASDSFTIRAGCDKLFATCRDRFANTDNFRGFPHIPGNDTVLRYAGQGRANDGRVL